MQHAINKLATSLIVLHKTSPVVGIISFQDPNIFLQKGARHNLGMDKQNKELYKENCQMMRENEILRRKAEKLNLENQALLSELKRRLLEANTKQLAELHLNVGSSSATGHKNGNKPRSQKNN